MWRPILYTSIGWFLVLVLYTLIHDVVELQIIIRDKKNSSQPYSILTTESLLLVSLHPPNRLQHTGDYNDETIQRQKRQQPNWAYKFDFMEIEEKKRGVPPFNETTIAVNEKICYVHVGKTAGSTLACYLGYDYGQCSTGTDSTSSLFSTTTTPKQKQSSSASAAWIDYEQNVYNMIPFQSRLPFYTSGMLHRQYDSCTEYELDHEQIHTYLFVVRNPLSRIRSWFEYERPRILQQENTTTTSSSSSNITNGWNTSHTIIRYGKVIASQKLLFIDCNYRTLNDLGSERGLGNSDSTNVCAQRAYSAISGETPYSAHNYYNYHYYYQKVLQNYNASVTRIQSSKSETSFSFLRRKDQQQQPMIQPLRFITIRTEHLEYDWDKIEMNVLLNITTTPATITSGSGNDNHNDSLNKNRTVLPPGFQFTHKNKSPKLIEDMYLSEKSQQNICKVLCQEIQVYKKILYQSLNIDSMDYETSMNELREDCPIQVDSNTCD